MKNRFWGWVLLSILCSSSAFAGSVLQLNIEGAIHEGTVKSIEEALIAAKAQKAQALLITLDTPGGMLESTRKIVKTFLNESDMPIIVYVTPTGARAGSAGTFITMSANIAAMAPGTNIGAAHPVTAGGKDPEENGKHMAEKIENDTTAFIASIAQERKRNEEWAKTAVIKSASIGATEAKKINVIDEIASDVRSLLNQIDGKTVKTHSKEIKLETKDAAVITFELDLKTKLLNFLAHPTTMMILMTIIGLGLYAEFSHPGLIFPAAAAIVAALLLMIANSIVPITLLGSLLILAGFTCLFLEIYIVSFGMLTVGGLTLFVMGALLLFDPKASDLTVPHSLIWSFCGGIGIIAIIISYSVGKTLKQPDIMGPLAMIGQQTTMVQPGTAAQPGKIFYNGEYWNAHSNETIEQGSTVEITDVNGLTVHVKKVS